MKELSPEQKATRNRILQVTYENKLSHLGSCLSAVDIIQAVYKVKEPNEKFVLSGGHAAVALYVVLEKYGLLDQINIHKLNIHPDRNPQIGIEVSTGSLGQGLPIAVGLALADKSKSVYCEITDGECAEGSIWEALRVASEQKLSNLKIIANVNGFGAYGEINTQALIPRFQAFGCAVFKVNGHNINELVECLKIKISDTPILLFAKTSVEQLSFLKGQSAHYRIMDTTDYKKALEEING